MSYRRRDREKLLSFVIPADARVRHALGTTPASGAPYEYVVVSGIDTTSDIDADLARVRAQLTEDGRLILTFRNRLWRPVVALAAYLRFRAPAEGNWFSETEVRHFLHLADFEIVRSGRRMLCPISIPLVSAALDRLGQLPLINRVCFTVFLIARPLQRERREYSVSIIVPARNEKGSIRSIIARMPRFGTEQELVLIEGHSNDGTWEEMQRAATEYQGSMTLTIAKQDGVGKGDALRKGFAMAKGEVLMIFDADMTVVPEDMPKFYEAIALGKGDFINGSRLVYPLEKGAMRFLNKLGNRFFAYFIAWFFNQRFVDVLCGTKVFRKKDYEAIAKDRGYFGDYDSFGDLELLLGALRRNLKVVDVPIRYRRRDYGAPQIKRFAHGWALLKMCLYAAWKIKR